MRCHLDLDDARQRLDFVGTQRGARLGGNPKRIRRRDDTIRLREPRRRRFGHELIAARSEANE
jgi:hypothetical protein